jgi:hypothetical protein
MTLKIDKPTKNKQINDNFEKIEANIYFLFLQQNLTEIK